MLIGVSGKGGSGKSTFALCAVQYYGAKELSFAFLLKQEVEKFLVESDIPYRKENLYGEQQYKEESVYLTPSICNSANVPIEDCILKYSIKDSKSSRVTFRSLMQWWGTDYRRTQDVDYWVSRIVDECSSNKLYVISDVRFRNEANKIKELSGYLVRIERFGNISISNMSHPSEIDLDEWHRWDFVINNKSDLKEYVRSCDVIIKKIINKG